MRDCIHHFVATSTDRLPLGITCDVVVCAADGAIVDAMVVAACMSIIRTRIPRFVPVPRRGRGEIGEEWKAAAHLLDDAPNSIGGIPLLSTGGGVPCLVATSFVHVTPSAQASESRSFLVMDPTSFEEQLALQKLTVINEVVLGAHTVRSSAASVFHWGGGPLSDDITSMCTQAATTRSTGMQEALAAAMAH
jgi:exosome complex RNA-binding protein Rrp42 (RNase PH superfamily)